ncbi:callose synthase 10-like isoform X2 [Phaseolus vulgaris]|uniref:callose synthase 10-like isoform X2 n=2 Tax=Phaseolus vulgaris TaxID=3885 RepID=UPI0035C98AC2
MNGDEATASRLEKAYDKLMMAQLTNRKKGVTFGSFKVAFIHADESTSDANNSKVFYSKLVKAYINGKDQEIYSIKLHGDPKLGEGKPENQNHAIIFTLGEVVQTIDMNQALDVGSDVPSPNQNIIGSSGDNKTN